MINVSLFLIEDNATLTNSLSLVNLQGELARPHFFVLDWGKSLPKLHQALFEVIPSIRRIFLNSSFPLKPKQPNSLMVGPMKPFQGPTPVKQR
jgi:hypothetical protein